MSEGILKALMQLFALVSYPTHESQPRRSIVKAFLNQQLSNQLTDEYLLIFDKYYVEHEHRLKNTEKLPQRISANAVKVLKITTVVNAELTFFQKIILLQQLIEFLNSGTGISSIEKEFIDNVAETLNIKHAEYESLYNFIVQPLDYNLNNPTSLIISGDKSQLKTERFFYWENLTCEIKILHIQSSGLLMLRYNGSMDLTINGQLLSTSRVHILRPGSSIRNPRINPIFYSDILGQFSVDNISTQVVFEVSDIGYSFKNDKVGLHSMGFTTQSSKLVGIMGDSGSGKTTLINILCGKYMPSHGNVKINGFDIHHQSDKINGLIGYVSQDDLLIEDLTVFQNLYYNAKLCFGNLSEFQIQRKVLKVIDSLGLYDAKDVKVGSPLNKKISGGQRKRLNIALELIREPSVLLLDEPTSGLSSRDSENIIDLLKELTLKGKLVFVVIHQPSSDIFKMFNQLLVLDTGGYLIYDGDAIESINYFKHCINHPNSNESECPVCGNVNAEQVLNIINAQILDEYGEQTSVRKIEPIEWYEKHIYHDKQPTDTTNQKRILNTLPKLTFKIPARLSQFKVFLTRDLLAKFANKQYLLINLLEAPILALILATIIKYWDVDAIKSQGYIFSNNPNLALFIFMSVIISIFIGLTVSAEEIINDRKILNRESFLNLSRASYLFSKLIILGGLSAIQTLLFVLVGNSIMEIKLMYLEYWLVLFSSSVFANILGLMISDSFKKTVNIYILIPFLIIPQLILSGVFVNYDRLNPKFSSPEKIPAFGEIIVARWAFEALVVNQFANNKYEQQFFQLEQQKSQAQFIKEYWQPAMVNKLEKCKKLFLAKETENLESGLELVRNELIKLNETTPSMTFGSTSSLTTSSFDIDQYQKTYDHLILVRKHFIKQFNNIDKQLDKIKTEKNSTPDKREAFLKLKNDYHNDDVERFVRNTNNLFSNKIVEYKNTLIQKIDPIFKEPESSFVSAHFLTATKKIGQQHLETYWVNVAVLWLFNMILFILLYLRALPKLFSMGNYHLQKNRDRKLKR